MDPEPVRRLAGSIETDAVVALASELCRIPSPLGEEGPLADLVAALLDHPGIIVHVQTVVPGRPNVIARVAGRGEAPALLLAAHLDAAVAPGWSRDPYDPWIADGRLHGGGITDMKGPIAAMIAAAQAAAVAGAGTLPGDLILHIVMGHNPTGIGAKYALVTDAPWTPGATLGISTQGSGLRLRAAHGGAIKFEIELTGRAAHVSVKETGIDALAAAADVERALRDLALSHEQCDRLPDLPKYLVGELVAGGAARVPALLPGSGVADRAILRGDVRTVPGMTRGTVAADLEAAVARAVAPGVVARTRIVSEVRPLMGPTDGPLVEALTAAHRLVRGEPVVVAQGLPDDATLMGDGSHYEAMGIPTVNYGPGPWRYMADEFIEIDQLVDGARVYLATALLLG